MYIPERIKQLLAELMGALNIVAATDANDGIRKVLHIYAEEINAVLQEEGEDQCRPS